jgi:hypothetical protein
MRARIYAGTYIRRSHYSIGTVVEVGTRRPLRRGLASGACSTGAGPVQCRQCTTQPSNYAFIVYIYVIGKREIQGGAGFTRRKRRPRERKRRADEKINNNYDEQHGHAPQSSPIP